MNKLTGLKVEEVSLVTAGANPDAQIIFYKRKGADSVSKLESLVSTVVSKMEAQLARAEDAEFMAVAKRYEILGTPADELAPILKAAKAQNAAAYETAIKTLDVALKAVAKAGIFEEVGKSGEGSRVSRIEELAAQIRKSNPALTYRQAIDAAYLAHPELQG